MSNENKLNSFINDIPKHPSYSRKAGYYYYLKTFSKLDQKKFSDVIYSVSEHYKVRDDILNFISKQKNILDKVVSFLVNKESTKKRWKYQMIKTIESSYIKSNPVTGKPLESPFQRLMRVSCSVVDLTRSDAAINVVKTYIAMCEGKYTHATPTLYNASSVSPQMSSCFTMEFSSKSTSDIYDGLKRIAIICDKSGGIGIDISNVGGTRDQFLRVINLINNTVSLIKDKKKGQQQRSGSVKLFCPIWHRRIKDFLDCGLKTPSDVVFERSNDIHYGVCINDEFMKRCYQSKNTNWTLFDPHIKTLNLDSDENKNSMTMRDVLSGAYGSEFSKTYNRMEKSTFDKDERSVVSAKDIMVKIVSSQMEYGGPSVFYIDTVNKSNALMHLGPIKTSNLCMEMALYTCTSTKSSYEMSGIGGVCNLASVCINRFVDKNNKTYDYSGLHNIVRLVCQNLNNVVTKTIAPTSDTSHGNDLTRSIGIGVQGFWEVFRDLRVAYGGYAAKAIASKIFETIYHAALFESNVIAMKTPGIVPNAFKNSFYSKGKFHFDFCDKKMFSGLYDWKILSEKIKKYGLANMQFVSPMPTVRTSLALGNSEGVDPMAATFYTRGESDRTIIVWDEGLVKRLEDEGLWNEKLKNKILSNRGQISKIEEIPSEIKVSNKYAWEMSMKDHIDMMVAITPFVDQAISMNIHLDDEGDSSSNISNKIYSCLYYAWESKLKTGVYYTRVKPVNTATNQGSMDEDCEFCSS